MSEFWQKFWSQHHPGAVETETDLFCQVGKTVCKKPIPKTVFNTSVNRIANQLQLSPGDHLFEFCCGNGLVTGELASRAGRITAVDFSENNIATARKLKSRHNINYLMGDAVAPMPHFLSGDDVPTKFLMNFSLAYFTPNDLGDILKNITQHLQQRPVLFLVAEIPNFDLKWNFYNTPERRARHLENEKKPENTNDGLGRWWRGSEIEEVCRDHGLGASLENQPPELSNYRMDALISTPVKEPALARRFHFRRSARDLAPQAQLKFT
jgi:SAM-dependent methyltransferase